MRCHGSRAIHQFSVLGCTVQCFQIYICEKGEVPNTRNGIPVEVRRLSCKVEPRRHLFRARVLTPLPPRAFVLRLFEHGKDLQHSRSQSTRA
jgi:hypothetical protein